MNDVAPQFEVDDSSGTTEHFNGSATTTAQNVPPTGTTVVSEVLISCPQQSGSNKLLVSFDNTNFITLEKGEKLAWGLRGGLRQFKVKSSGGSVAFEVLMNKELI